MGDGEAQCCNISVRVSATGCRVFQESLWRHARGNQRRVGAICKVLADGWRVRSSILYASATTQACAVSSVSQVCRGFA